MKPICLWFREYYVVWGFLITAISSLLIGQFLYRNFQETGETQLRHAMIMVFKPVENHFIKAAFRSV
ncbi:hypothetical protein NIES4071_08920 [Calothrix sp. NIES-4071]|nr:hypothetical protein NIES4071_08920 [Calothrix sp. NIES-4071]BAZ55234.1 hypothetical protein NIES4105_08880 [Calothrix sp. NIES-4105]